MKQPGGIGADDLCAFIDRIERLEEETAELTADMREINAAAKGGEPGSTSIVAAIGLG